MKLRELIPEIPKTCRMVEGRNLWHNSFWILLNKTKKRPSTSGLAGLFHLNIMKALKTERRCDESGLIICRIHIHRWSNRRTTLCRMSFCSRVLHVYAHVALRHTLEYRKYKLYNTTFVYNVNIKY